MAERIEDPAELCLECLSAGTLGGAQEVDRECFLSPALQVDFSAELEKTQSRCLVARDGEEVVAYLLYWLVAEEMQILNIAVKSGCRRRGWGRLLLEKGIRDARGEGAWVATLEVRKSNEEAIALYQGNGFRILGTRLDYYREPEEDALLMVRAFDEHE
jgi:ribosomal-protein-alanine N-acetyltransferase